jgi:NNP family nitrate/nitrite transporter-like MFS transporter
MDIESPGSGIMATRGGEVTAVSDTEIRVGDESDTYSLDPFAPREIDDSQTILLPVIESWHEPLVEVGQQVEKRQLLAQGVTHIYFQANVWVFTGLVFIIGIAMGIGKAAVYKYIPEYFPTEVGVVGGIVGVVGGLGGFVSPIIFGYLLETIGLWTMTWVFFFFVTMASLIWLSLVVRRISLEDTRIEGKKILPATAPAD